MTVSRRAVLKPIGTVGALSIAGCLRSYSDGQHGGGDRVDEKGDIEVVIDGSPVNLSEDRFQAEHADNTSMDFHLHESDDHWYMEGERRVTFAEAMDLLPYFEYTRQNDDHVIAFDGTDYDEGDPGTTITFIVNGDEVEPTDYTLQDGDDLLVEITTED